MQASNDASVKFISKAFGSANDRNWYRLTCSDGKDVLSVYCTAEAFQKLEGCQFGTDISMAFDISSGRSGVFVTCTDIQVFNG